MSMIAWGVFALTAGLVAPRLYGSRGSGFVFDLLLGIVGALAGGFLFHALGVSGIDGFTIWSLLVAVVGAVAALGVKRLVQERVFT